MQHRLYLIANVFFLRKNTQTRSCLIFLLTFSITKSQLKHSPNRCMQFEKKMTIKEYFLKIKESPGGLNYFYSWIKYYTKDKEHYKVHIVRNYFDKPESERRKLNKVAEEIFIKKAKKYIRERLEFVEDDIKRKEELKKTIKKNYYRIKELAGGYYSFYGWIRENYPELKSRGLSETTIRNAIFESHETKFIKEYENFANIFNNLVDTYFELKDKKGFIYESEINSIPKEVLTSFHQYFIFFSDYLLSIKDFDVNFNVLRTENGLKFKIVTEQENDINVVKHHLDEYISIARNVIIDGKDLHSVIEKMNLLEISKLRLETEINHLKSTLRIVEFENKHLKENSDFLKQLSFKLAEQKPTITNQVITDGNQQFADKIENK